VIRSPLLAACGVAATVLCSGGVVVAGDLDVQITTVRATERGPSDAQLVDLRARLRRLVPGGYRSYRIIQDERRRCTWGSSEAFAIPGGRLLHVVPKGMRDQAVMMQIQLRQGSQALVDTDVRLQNRGVFLFGVQPSAGMQKGTLIIMVRAED
jgi:hypothetical protein